LEGKAIKITDTNYTELKRSIQNFWVLLIGDVSVKEFTFGHFKGEIESLGIDNGGLQWQEVPTCSNRVVTVTSPSSMIWTQQWYGKISSRAWNRCHVRNRVWSESERPRPVWAWFSSHSQDFESRTLQTSLPVLADHNSIQAPS
jgi:hypothetical protein